MNVSVAELTTLIRRAACGVGWSYASAEELAALHGPSGGAAAALTDIAAGEGAFVSASHEPPKKPRARPDVPDDVWRSLTLLAANTYVPATDASRTAGAGAGLTDND